ncbi:endonuclease/exonuclease/phosphatase family protein [Desulfosediminicola flagellatus]|uniref:endonuclease/exonuclease/phosphatase family protein n=1 Tax=Desulfosediminicola flagellatus TaxID=2569541 RepID=UPI0010AC3AAE|nr:endonuclease/exonuclease/phosphatase family protein [Desulfosediminicola flagellatus]
MRHVKARCLRIIPILLLLQILCACPRVDGIRAYNIIEQPERSRTDITVMSYNIRVGRGASRPGVDPFRLTSYEEKLFPVAQAIRSVDPDIIGLQEVHGFWQAKRLAEMLRMNFAYVSHDTGGKRNPWWGVAVLSRYPITDSRELRLSTGRGNSKSALVCTINVAGQPITVLSVHKDKDLRNGMSFKRLMAATKDIETPLVLVGDFNVVESDWRLDLLRPMFIDSALVSESKEASIARDIGTFKGIGRIDYIFVESKYFQVIDSGIIAPKYWDASDHIGYYARMSTYLTGNTNSISSIE